MDFDYTHLAPLELAARLYCEMEGQNPDEQMDIPHPLMAGVKLQRPAWHFPAEHMLNLSKMLVCMKQAEAAKKAEPAPAAPH